MKVKDLIAKLQKVDPDLDVIIEPGIDVSDAEYTPYPAYRVLHDDISPITFRVDEAQSNRESVNDSWDEDWIECFYDNYINPVDRKKVLVISSPEFKYGTTEEEESTEFK
jgi:hypothetical protein